MAIAIRARHLAQSLLAFALLLPAAQVARGAVIHVTHFDDAAAGPGTCTLRQAVRAANENGAIGACEAGENSGTDQILVAAGTHLVNLTTGSEEDSALTGDLDLLQNVDVRGVSTAMTIVDGSGGTEIDRLFDIHAGVTVVMEQLTLRRQRDRHHGAGRRDPRPRDRQPDRDRSRPLARQGEDGRRHP